jgi:hypothetical protein
MSQTPPMRVETIEYQPQPPPRPGALTAVGIISIVIAGFGILLGCSGIIEMIVFGMIGAVRPPRTIPTSAPATMPITGSSATLYYATAASSRYMKALAIFYGISGLCNFALAVSCSLAGFWFCEIRGVDADCIWRMRE